MASPASWLEFVLPVSRVAAFSSVSVALLLRSSAIPRPSLPAFSSPSLTVTQAVPVGAICDAKPDVSSATALSSNVPPESISSDPVPKYVVPFATKVLPTTSPLLAFVPVARTFDVTWPSFSMTSVPVTPRPPIATPSCELTEPSLTMPSPVPPRAVRVLVLLLPRPICRNAFPVSSRSTASEPPGPTISAPAPPRPSTSPP